VLFSVPKSYFLGSSSGFVGEIENADHYLLVAPEVSWGVENESFKKLDLGFGVVNMLKPIESAPLIKLVLREAAIEVAVRDAWL
jgi:hypothetical protein